MRRDPIFEQKNFSGDLGVSSFIGLEQRRRAEVEKQNPSAKNQEGHHEKAGGSGATFLDTVGGFNTG